MRFGADHYDHYDHYAVRHLICAVLCWLLLVSLDFFLRSGRGSAWLERLVRDQEVGGSNPLAPTTYPEASQAFLIRNFHRTCRIGNIWEQNCVFEPFHGFSLPTGKHMRVAERSLQIRMPQNRLRHTQRLMLVQQSRARVTQVMPTHLRKPD